MNKETLSFFYDEKNNVFYDEGGYVVFNISNFVTPNMLYLFRYYKESVCVKSQYGYSIILEYCTCEECF